MTILPLRSLLLTATALAAFAGGAQAREQSVSVANVNGVELRVPIDATIQIGPAPSAVLDGDDAILNRVTAEVRNGTLVIEPREKNSSNDWRESQLKARITLPALAALSVGGSGHVAVKDLAGGNLRLASRGSSEIKGTGKLDRLDADIHGSGSVDLRNASVKDAELNIRGSGDIAIGGVEGGAVKVDVRGSGNATLRGRADRLTANLSGSGDIHAAELRVQDAQIAISGSGNAEVQANGKLDVTRNGSGSVNNRGTAQASVSDRASKWDKLEDKIKDKIKEKN